MEHQESRDVLRRAGQESAARRRIILHHCRTCGAEIRGLTTRRYCSDACRAKAYRLRRATGTQPLTPAGTRGITPERVAAFVAQRDAIVGDQVFPDSTEIIRRNRDEQRQDV